MHPLHAAQPPHPHTLNTERFKALVAHRTPLTSCVLSIGRVFGCAAAFMGNDESLIFGQPNSAPHVADIASMQIPLRFFTARTTCAEEHAPATDDLRNPCGAWAQSVCTAYGTLECKSVPSLDQAAATARPRAVATSQAAGCASMPRAWLRTSQPAPTAVSCPHLCQARPSCLRVSPMPVEAEPADAANSQTSSAAVEARPGCRKGRRPRSKEKLRGVSRGSALSSMWGSQPPAVHSAVHVGLSRGSASSCLVRVPHPNF